MFEEITLINGLLTFLLSMLLTQLVQKYASKIGMLDIPNERSSHAQPTPRGAGIAIFIAFILVLASFYSAFFIQHSGFFVAVGIIFMLGVVDDAKDVSPRLKLIFIILATTIIFFSDHLGIKTLGFWFGHEVQLSFILSFIVTLFAVAGFTNALNLIDGLDGLAGSISLVVLASLYYIGFVYHDQFIMIISFTMMVSLLGFLLFNWYPASIFMGDSGSLVLGFIISALAIKATDYVSDTTILFIAAVPIIDTIIVMTRRIQRGLSPFSPDKSHFHHKILMLKGSVDASVHILVALQIILSVIGLLLRDKNDITNLVLFLVILFVFFQALDDRKEHRTLLFISKLKLFFTKITDKVGNTLVITLTSIVLIGVLMVRLFTH